MTEILLYDAVKGDKLVQHNNQPIASLMKCPGGHQVLISAGFEAKHMMPLGLHRQLTEDKYYGGVDDQDPMTWINEQVKALKDHGAVVSMVHSEEKDISASTIDKGGFEVMEWYNIHANFSVILDKDIIKLDIENIPRLTSLLTTLVNLKDFLLGTTNGPHPDLIYLTILNSLPWSGFEKWQQVVKSRPITGVLGSDIHQNVSIDASICNGPIGQLACTTAINLVADSLGIKIPAIVSQLLISGGKIVLSDGDRIDSYQRLMRWMENRTLVDQQDQLKVQQALREGRNYGVFTIFGDPQGFSFTANNAATTYQLGDKPTAPVTFNVIAPKPRFVAGPPFTTTEALSAKIRLKFIRIDDQGMKIVSEVDSFQNIFQTQITKPGAYYVELWIKPTHLLTALGTVKALADKEYLWVITNPIYLSAS